MLVPVAATYSLVDLSFLDALSDAEEVYQEKIVKARLYYEGEHPTYLTNRMKEYLDLDDNTDFSINVCRQVITAVSERLTLESFACPNESQAAWIEQVFTNNKLESVQHDVHENALVDAEAFVIVSWDKTTSAPIFTPHPRYTSTKAEGNGFGCIMVYPDDDPSLPALYAVKHWGEWMVEDGKKVYRRRVNVYFPDRIEKYIYIDSFVPWADPAPEGGEAQPWPIPWTTSNGESIGIPVFHFVAPGMRGDLTDALSPQDVVNKTVIDLVAAADTTAFQTKVALGFIPTTDGEPLADDGSNALQHEIGGWIGTQVADADIKTLEPANLTPLLDVLEKFLDLTATVTTTPRERFAKTLSSADTLNAQREPLFVKAARRQARFGSAWVSAMKMARRLGNVFGALNQDETVSINAVWAPIHKRSQEEITADLTLKKNLGVPVEKLWSELGYTQQEIEQMKASPEYQAMIAMAQMNLSQDGG